MLNNKSCKVLDDDNDYDAVVTFSIIILIKITKFFQQSCDVSL